jgi:uncharacterized membrane protein YjgN (DUF898 family)
MESATMESTEPNQEPHRIKFYGEGSTLFGIIIVNVLLTFVTLGLYYPWARAKLLRYYYSETEFAGSRFEFLGTGKEMFKGFIKAIGILIVIYALFIFGAMGKHFLLIFIAYLLILAIIPFAIHGFLKYRLSRTVWRGIHFGYHGDLREFIKLFFKNILITLCTCGIYGMWMSVNLHSYTQNRIRLGNAQLKFEGEGVDLFVIYLKGYFLSIITLGIYAFWWITEMHKFYINHTSIIQGENEYPVTTNINGWDFLKLSVVNILIIIFTLGIGLAWVQVRTMRFYLENIEIPGGFDPNALVQTEGDYKDATGDDMLSMMDLNLG